jgi:hypothetical protein
MTPAERVAQWTATDAAIGIAAEAEQLRARLTQRDAEVADDKARIAQLTHRVAQVESENSQLRRNASRVPVSGVARKVNRKARSIAARRLRR